jgi:hypothetical protein
MDLGKGCTVHSTWEMGSHYVAQAVVELVSSNDPSCPTPSCFLSSWDYMHA